MDQKLEVEEKEQSKFLIMKFQKRGFEGLALEDVANALVLPDFSKQFNAMTGQDWNSKYEVKALERLNRAKFDIQWMTRKDGDPHTPLFVNCARGDLNKVRQYLRECKDTNVKNAVDQQKRSPLHICAQEGKAAIVELLLLNNFNPNARDRCLRTPLHYAALHGWDAVADTLLRTGADILAKDSQGRSSIHFAACGPSSVILQLLLSTKPELVNDLDHKRRSPLHYGVWNSSANQVDLLRTLLDFNSNPNAIDDDQRTPVHDASEGGRTRAIPILLQRGGLQSMATKDRKGRLPLDLAANDRTREILIVYSASPLSHKQDDIEWMNQAVQGVGKPVVKLAEPEVNQSKSPSTVMQRKTVKLNKEQPAPQTLEGLNEPQQTPAPTDQQAWGPTTINAWIREKFFVIMKKVQESGIKANHHLKKPYIYTASWMEGINTMEELYDSLKDVSPGETAMRIFNLLCPYDRPLPKRAGTEEIVDGFYGEQWYDTGSFTNQKRSEEAERVKRALQMEYVNRIAELETAVQLHEKAQFESDQELAKTKAQLEVIRKTQQDQEGKLTKQLESLTTQLLSKDNMIGGYKSDLTKLQKKNKEVQMELDTWKNTPQGPSEEDIQQYLDEIRTLKDTHTVEREKEKQLRFKSGQLFVKAIKDAQETALQAAMQQQKQLETLNVQKIREQAKAEVLPESAAGGLENMQDDDSMISLLKALKGNPPPMKQRMTNVDGDSDGKVTQQEFSDFLKALKLSDQDVMSLSRIAGFLNGKKLLGIEEWMQILQDRPKQREMWEQKLFNKLLDAIKAKNMTLDRVFELLDTDNSGTVSPAELRIGLKQLKIVLNQKDLNNMFCIFDADKSGQISLPEMKETLDHYVKLRAEQGEDDNADWGDRLSQADPNEVPYEDIPAKDDPYPQQVGKDWVINEKDFNVLNGNLKVQLPRGTGLLDMASLKVIMVRVILRGADRESTLQFTLFTADMEWKQALMLPIRSTLRENLCEHLIVQLYSSPEHLDEDHFLGDVHTSWKACLDQPGQWVINNQFQITNKTYVKEAKRMKVVSGSLNLEVKYETGQPGSLADMKPSSGAKSFEGTIVEEGVLEITLVQCILSDDNKNLKDGKYYCDLKFMDVNETEIQAKLSANNDLYWEQKYLQNLKCVTLQQIPAIYANVYVQTPKNLLQHNTKTFGELFINWQECILHPGQYLSTKSFLLSNDPSKPQKLYMKVRYVPQSMFQQVVGFKADVSDKDKRKQLTEEDMQEGTMKLLFVRGKNLRADDGDTSDPYCLVKLESWQKQIKVQSKTIKKTLNPEWRDMQVIQCKVPKEAPFPPLEVEVFDEDVLGDDSLGTCKVDLAPAFENPCTWGVNDLFKLVDPKQKPDIVPQVYLQTYWVPKGMKDPNLKAKDKEDQAGGDPDPNSIDGTMVVKVVHARELNAGKGVTPDPYCTITYPGGVENKTDAISSTVNPVWNQTLQSPIKVDRATGMTIPLKLFLKDHNILADSVIGYVDVNWAECVTKPGEWAVNQVFKLSGTQESHGQLGSLGFVYLQIKFLERGMIDDGAEAPLVENLLDMIASKQGIWQGTLKVFLVHCRDLVKSDSGSDELSDPYVIFKVPGGKKLETKAKKKTLNPSWKTIYPLQIAMPKDTVQPLKLEVYDEDLVGDEMIGYATADLSQCFLNPQKWSFNEVLNLSGDLNMQNKYKTQLFGKVYLQIMFCLQGVDCQDPPLPLTEDIDEILREKAEENKKPIKGSLLINVPLAMGVKAADSSTQTSDPYCKITLPDGHTIETKQVEKTLDPIWNFTYKWNCNIIKEQYKPIKFEVFDTDALAKDDILGSVEVEWMDCFTNPTVWEVNKLLPLTGEQDMGQDLGKLYIQMNFLLDGQEKTPEGQRAPDTIPELKDQFGRVLGTVQVKIISAASLYNADLMGKSDPFVETYLSTDASKKMKTTVIPDNLNPQWNFDGTLSIQLLRCQVKQCSVIFDVKDDDEVGADFIGNVEIELIDVLELNPQSQMTGDYPLKNADKKGTPTLGTLKVTMIWVPDPYNEGVVGLRKPLPTYTGDLVVNFPNGRQLPKGDPYVKFFLTHLPEKVYDYGKKYIKSNQNPEFNYSETIPLVEIPESSVRTLRVTSTVRNYNLLKDTTFGGITVPITDLFHSPGTWVNGYNQLFDDDGNRMDSYLYVQAQYRPKDGKVDPAVPALVDFKTFINQGKPPTVSGQLVITYIGLKNIQSMDIMGLSDPFVEIKLSKGTKTAFTTKVQDDKTDCFWENPGAIAIADVTADDLALMKMFVSVFDYDYDKNDLIGKSEYDLSKLVAANGSWLNDRVGLMDEKGFPEKSEIYIQCQWVQTGLPAPNVPKPPNLYLDIKQKQDEAEAQKKKDADAQAAIPKCPGKLRLYVEGARNLIKADTFGQSDPFCEFKISKGDKTTIKTKTIDDNSNPVWKFSGGQIISQTIEFTLNMQEQEYVDMMLMATVSDYDTLVSSDFLGFVEVNLDDLFKNPGIDGTSQQIYLLKDEHGNDGKNGDIYLQVQWIPDASKDKIAVALPQQKPYGPIDAKLQQQQSALQQSQVPVPTVTQGILQTNILRITQLPPGKKAQTKLTILGQEVKTNLVQSGVDFNTRQALTIKPSDATVVQADIIVLDETGASMGSVSVDLSSTMKAPGTWINQYYPLQVSNFKPNNQKVYLQIQWRPGGQAGIDTTEPALLEDPDANAPPQLPQTAQVVPPKGTIKVAIISAEKILLLDGGKTSNTKCTVESNGNEDCTPKIKGTNPQWKTILKPLPIRVEKVADVKPIYVRLDHDPGMLSTCKFIGDVTIADLSALFSKPGEWSIKQNFMLGDSKQQSKIPITGFVTLQIGFIPDKSKDTLTTI